MSKNIIELNGKRYDALTGKLLGATHQHPKPSMSGKVIDGFVRPTAKAKPAATAPARPAKDDTVLVHVRKGEAASKPAQVAVATVNVTKEAPKVAAKEQSQARAAAKAATAVHETVKASESPRNAVSHAISVKTIAAHQPERAKTLMGRHASKPAYTIKPAIKPVSPVEIAPLPNSKIAAKHSVARVDPTRLERAQRTLRHAAVDRFGHITAAAVALESQAVRVKQVADLAVHAEPKQSKPIDIFEEAIAHATSHTQPLHQIPKSRKRRILNIAGFSTAFLVIATFFAFLNMPNIQLNVASLQAGFKASIPDYAPLGYAMAGGIQRAGDTVSMVFRSGENKFTITQQHTSWDNEKLLQNTLALQHNYQTVQADGSTIYVYGDNAVWLKGNVRYDISANAPLSATDISQLALSM
ncbi:MAG TPA: hypothetical protein VLH84_00665 [Patescibacteria group bacterium]|nr:hypothetical protein [Patescibacteria group bacterium]